MTPNPPISDPPRNSHPSWIQSVAERAAHLKYGSILITIHDSRVTQIDVLEKLRMPQGHPSAKNPETGSS